jgi:hypothetical protein
MADFKVHRALYFVEQIPTGTLDKIPQEQAPRDGGRAPAGQ